MKKCTEYTLGKTIISSEYDDCPMDDIYGTYDQKYTEGCIVRADGSFFEDHIDDDDYEPKTIRGELSFFHPADNGEKPGSLDYRKYSKQDYRRMCDYDNQHWSYRVVKVETFITTNNGISDSVFDTLCGIESDGGKDYLKEIVDNLKYGVKENLRKMGFSDEEINQSVDHSKVKKGEIYL